MRLHSVPQFPPRSLRSLRLCVHIFFLGSTTLFAQTSHRETYHVTIEKPAQAARRAGESSTWRFRVVDREGAVRTEILRELPFDISAPAPVVFENGTVALIHSFDNLVEFFGTDGGLTRRISLSQIPNPVYERVIRHTAHDSLLVLLISEPGSSACRLIVLDARGNILRERSLEGLQAIGVAISPNGRTIAAGIRTSGASESGEVWLIDRAADATAEGREEEKWSDGVRIEASSGSFSYGTFSPDGSVFLGRTNVAVIAVDVAAGTKRWDLHAPAGRLVVDAVLGANGASVLLADAPTLEKGTWIYRRPVMRVVARDGTVVSERSVPSMGFSKAKLVPRAGTTVVEFDGVVY